MISTFFTALLLLLLLLFIAQFIKNALFPKLILPPSIIAGFIALILGPELLGSAISSWLNGILNIPDGLFSEDVMKVWKELPVYLITVVFAGLFLGKEVPSIGKIWDKSLPNLAYGYTLAFGQYVVGLLAAALILVPLFDANILSGALVAIGFQGGHGTVAGLDSTFRSLEFEQATDLGLGIATLGLLTAIVFGTIMSNIAPASGQGTNGSEEAREAESSKSLRLPFQLTLLGISIALGWCILNLLQYVENLIAGDEGFKLFYYVPLFPVAMIGGLLIQVTFSRLPVGKLINKQGIDGLSNLALDLLVVSALASLSLETLLNNWYIVAILSGVGILYNIAIYFGLARFFFGNGWKIKGLGELGQSMGTTAIGLLLLKNTGTNSDQIKSFSYKQPLYEPIVGGGLVTAIALPLIAQLGAYVFAFSGLVICLIVLGGFYWYKKIKND